MKKFACVVLISCVATAMSAQTLTTLASFEESTTGANPDLMSLVQGFDGNFYGAASGGGPNFGGTVFKITPSGALTTVYAFCWAASCLDGSTPDSGLVQATDGNLYGTTVLGGANNHGTVFKLSPTGVLTTLYNFCAKPNCKDGSYPVSGLIQAADGNFYGTTSEGGRGENCTGAVPCGTVFRITAAGLFSTIYSFCNLPSCTDGGDPIGNVIQANDASLYGTTAQGGLGFGTIFRIVRGGTLTTVHSFEFDGAHPYAGLVQNADGTFNGTTNGCIDAVCDGDGTVFKLTRNGQLGDQRFNGANGEFPFDGVVTGTDGNLYGTTFSGGKGTECDSGCGIVFRFGPGHLLTTLYNFCTEVNCPDGSSPTGGLVQGTDGNFYGTTTVGGGNGSGTIFVLNLGLGPFVRTVPTTGKASSSVFILGTNLTGASSVTFNGTPATFTVISATEITTTVPPGATSGTVQVTTPSGALTSNVVFRVN